LDIEVLVLVLDKQVLNPSLVETMGEFTGPLAGFKGPTSKRREGREM